MTDDPALVAETKTWLCKAAMDLRAAEHDLSASPPLLEDVLFHCQQAVEKSLKAFLVWHSCPFRKTHSLEELGRQCVQIHADFQDIVDSVVPLTQYAWNIAIPASRKNRHSKRRKMPCFWLIEPLI
jgi:HEPN domain-containing protein